MRRTTSATARRRSSASRSSSRYPPPQVIDGAVSARCVRTCTRCNPRLSVCACFAQRLDRHTEISLEKYAEMDQRLRDDPRLVHLTVA